MKNNAHIYTLANWLFCVWLVISLVGCRTSRPAVEEVSSVLKAEDLYFRDIYERLFSYETLTAQLQIELKTSSKDNFRSRAVLKINKNERISLSIQPLLGIEAFRLELIPDSITIIDRLNKRFLSESLTFIQKGSPSDINFHVIQSLLTNQLFLPGVSELPVSGSRHFHWERLEGGYELSVESKQKLRYVFTTDATHLNVSSITDRGGAYALNWSYSSFQPVANQDFPMQSEISLTINGASKATLSIRYTRVDLSTPLSFQPINLSEYRRVSVSEIIKQFK